MNCQDVAELLPWYLNGTLEEREKEEIRDHLAGCESCRAALEDTRLAWRVHAQHIAPEDLVALAWGDRPEGEGREILERHLQRCPECAAELELARTSRGLEEDDRIALFPRAVLKPARPAVSSSSWRAGALAAGLAGLVALGGWLWSAQRVRGLEDRLAEAARPPQAVAAAPSGPAVVDPAERERLAALAAKVDQLQSTESEMHQRETELREQLAQLTDTGASAPQVNSWIADLRPTTDVVRGGSARAQMMPAGAPAALILHPSHAETHKDHSIEIVDAAGKTVWSAGGLRRNPETDDFSINVPKGALKPGTYTIRISAEENGKKAALESFVLRVGGTAAEP